MTKLLKDLIAIPSVNPAFAEPGPHAGEQQICSFLAGLLSKTGIEVALMPVATARPNLIARVRPGGRVRTRLLIAPHTDTVGGVSAQFSPHAKAGRIYGRGACDTKGSLAVACAVLTDLALNGNRPVHTEIILAALADEEHGQLGSRALVASGMRADLAIVGEPTGLRIVTAHKGSLWLEFQTHGKAAHGATPQFGCNAVCSMARIVTALETKYARSLHRRRHPLLGSATISVGTISGGVQPNVVPDRCTMTVDRRTLPGETERSVRSELVSMLKQSGLRASIRDMKPAACPPLCTSLDLPLVRQLLDCAGQARPAGVDFFCDAAVLSRGGVPSVVFGPGNIAQAHTADEWVSIRSLDAAVALLKKYLNSLP